MQSFSEESKKFLKDYLFTKKLSKREIEVVMLVIQGMTNREVANQLCIAEKTVKFHLTNVYKRLGIARRSQIFWALPLVDFISLNKKNSNLDSSSSSQPNEEQSEELIPAGSSTVNDQVG